jgi:hypothetical protein
MVFTSSPKIFTILVGLTIALSVMVSCNNQEGIPTYVNPNLSDTSGKFINLDLFISGELDNVPFTVFNGRDSYTNWTISSEEGYCGQGFSRFIQSHTTSFLRAETSRNSFYIDFKGCLDIDSLVDESRIDSVLVVGQYPLYPKFEDYRTVVVRYIDENEILWTSNFGPNSSTFSSFELSALEENDYDDHSKLIAFGRFEGYLYNGAGDSIRLRSGKFKGRIVE